MSNLQKFNETLDEFNQEVHQLKKTSGAYKKLQELIEKYDNINTQFEINNKTLGNINNVQLEYHAKLVRNLTEIENANKKNKIELAILLEEKTDQIRKENKEFYKELESTIKIKLDENKSQIKQVIENERNQIKQIFEIEFARNTKDLIQVIKRESNKQTQLLSNNQKTIKILIWVLGGLTIIFSALAVIKLWM